MLDDATLHQRFLDLYGELPRAAWVDEYYGPLRERVRACRERWPSALETDALPAGAEREAELFERRGDEYGYALFVLRAPA